MLKTMYFTGDFSKSAAKVRLFFQSCKYFARKSPFLSILPLFFQKNLAVSAKIPNFAHCNCNVQKL